MNRKQILESYLENIASIADEEYQKRVWVRAEGPECDDIDDTIGDFFDDGDFIFEEYKEFGITEIQYENLMKLREKLRYFTDTYGVYFPYKSTLKLIQMPQWEEIRGLAKNVLEAFNYPMGDLRALKALENAIDVEDAKKALRDIEKHGTVSWEDTIREIYR